MALNGFGFSGYRSFGAELAHIAPLQKINLIIGQNNVGKSNIINFLNHQYPYIVKRLNNKGFSRNQQDELLKDLDYHRLDRSVRPQVAFPLRLDEVEDYIQSKLNKDGVKPQHRKHAKKVLLETFPQENDHVWFVYEGNDSDGRFKIKYDPENCSGTLSSFDWQSLWNILTHKSGGGLLQHWVPETIDKLMYYPTSELNIVVIPSIREIREHEVNDSDYSGKGIIEKLAKIQNPGLEELNARNKFDRINDFVKTVLDKPDAKLEIPYKRDMILIHMDQKTLPLSSIGTGVHEVIILAAAATILEKTIVCVEEPELHLHPLLQKKLVRYLAAETDNQYIFTTHSAHLLDSSDAEIFHVTQKEGASTVESIYTTKQKSLICNDLGYRASDILQSNCIIWVEGPSDRIYINYWLKYKQPELAEGIDYSIMFYGGRLASHLSALDEDESDIVFQEMISVRKLNRNAVIVMDSDKDGPRKRINKTKKRLLEEFEKGPGFAWITKGREIENYFESTRVEKAVCSVHTSASRLENMGQWSNLLKYRNKRNSEVRTADKMKVANQLTSQYPPNFDVLDLDIMISKLIDFIYTSNDNVSDR